MWRCLFFAGGSGWDSIRSLAEIVNRERISWRNVHVFPRWTSFFDWQGRPDSARPSAQLRGRDAALFRPLIDPELRIPDAQYHRAASRSSAIDAIGEAIGVGAGGRGRMRRRGFGYHGHVAFNEPLLFGAGRASSVEERRNADADAVTLGSDSILVQSIGLGLEAARRRFYALLAVIGARDVGDILAGRNRVRLGIAPAERATAPCSASRRRARYWSTILATLLQGHSDAVVHTDARRRRSRFNWGPAVAWSMPR